MEKKVLFNSLWMMLEKVISIFGLIFVTSFVARYVGPTVFGEIAYATSLFQIIQVLAQLGSDVIIFKRVAKKESSGIRLINTTVGLRGGVYLISSLPILIYFFVKYDATNFLYVFSVFLSCFFYSLDVFSIFYDARLESKRNTIVNTCSLIICLMIRWLIPFLKLNPIFLCIPIVFTSFIPLCVRIISYSKNFKNYPKTKRHKKKYMSYVLLCGLSLVISSLSVAIYPRLGMLILGSLQNSAAVGVYSVAATLASSWAFVCNSFITSSLPSMFREDSESRTIFNAAQISIIVSLFSSLVIIGFYLLGNWVLKTLYGISFASSFTPMIILCISTFISMLGTISARLIAKYSGYMYLSKKMLLVTIFSVVFNYIFISKFGVIGAAIATLLTELISLTLCNYLFKNGLVLKLHVSTFLLKPIFRRVKSK